MWQTREISIGKVKVGGKNPVRIQSMTTTPTHEIEKTATQVLQLEQKGCEIVRFTVQGKKEALAAEKIREYLEKKGCTIPLVADIHFYPPAALLVTDFVDKVRINPGNFLDKRATFTKQVYSEEEYQKELLKIEEGFSPLVEKCKKQNKAIRIGVNHGSLSDRIMNRFGDTPHGMVESALEYAKVCRKRDFHTFLFSMKSSNPKIMVEAYLLLVEKMKELSWDYPLHLGVTEAGLSEEGRIKSSIGIGSLLCEGIGDTIRVSLTEDPLEEIYPAKKIVEIANTYRKNPKEKPPFFIGNSSVKKEVEVFNGISAETLKEPSFFLDRGIEEKEGKLYPSFLAPKGFFIKGNPKDIIVQNRLAFLQRQGFTVFLEKNPPCFFTETTKKETLLINPPSCIFVSFSEDRIHKTRELYQFLQENGLSSVLILAFSYEEPFEEALYRASIEVGSLLLSNVAEGVCLSLQDSSKEQEFMFSILQACGLKKVKTEYVSCPGCGRTLFDLQEVTKRIQAKTSHLPGVKIAVMGCIVNGPGEMADADFGFVGSKKGKIDLYIGKTPVEKFLDFTEAEERLISLIKKEGKWIDPPVNKEEELLFS